MPYKRCACPVPSNLPRREAERLRALRSAGERGLGIALPTAGTIWGGLQNLLGIGGNPKDVQRMAMIDAMFDRGMMGDPNAEAWLACWSGDNNAIAKLQAIGAWNPTDTACGLATDKAKAYAAQKLVELKARRAAGQIGIKLVGASTLPYQGIGAAVGALQNPWVVGGLALGTILLLRRSQRRRR